MTVRAAVLPESTPAHWSVRVSVRDRGVGLAPREVARLVQPYTQIRAAEMQAGCVRVRTPLYLISFDLQPCPWCENAREAVCAYQIN